MRGNPVRILVEHIDAVSKLGDDETADEAGFWMVGIRHNDIAVEAVHSDSENIALRQVDDLGHLLDVIKRENDVLGKSHARTSLVRKCYVNLGCGAYNS